jgi:uncharacterized protein (DUF2249 family)/hemerythrin-like domain-containing protein
MEIVKTINVKGMDHQQRESIIFPTIRSLRAGETGRLIVEFNPLPLVYMFRAGGDLEVSYEKEGPDEWILNIKRVHANVDARANLKQILQELRRGNASAETKEKARTFFQAVDAKSLGELEQELIREGVTHDEIRSSLCDIHLEVLGQTLVEKRIQVFAPHPVHTMMEEHKIIVGKLNELNMFVQNLKSKDSFVGMEQELKRLQNIAHHLVEAENHHLREEEALFPVLERHNVVEPPSIMKMDHVEFRKRKRELFEVAQKPESLSFIEFKHRVIELGEYLNRELGSHIFKEDNILYQIALQILSPEEWEQIKEDCDRIGYCCFTPVADAPDSGEIELDLRSLPPFQRHDLIMQKWAELTPGRTLRIINDHDPKPLRYQFEAEFPGKFTWVYASSGPEAWEVNISKIQS